MERQTRVGLLFVSCSHTASCDVDNTTAARSTCAPHQDGSALIPSWRIQRLRYPLSLAAHQLECADSRVPREALRAPTRANRPQWVCFVARNKLCVWRQCWPRFAIRDLVGRSSGLGRRAYQPGFILLRSSRSALSTPHANVVSLTPGRRLFRGDSSHTLCPVRSEAGASRGATSTRSYTSSPLPPHPCVLCLPLLMEHARNSSCKPEPRKPVLAPRRNAKGEGPTGLYAEVVCGTACNTPVVLGSAPLRIR